MSQKVDIERKLYLLRCMNPTVVTQSTADEAKWAADSIEQLRLYIAACPARDFWKKAMLQDARIRQLLNGLIK